MKRIGKSASRYVEFKASRPWRGLWIDAVLGSWEFSFSVYSRRLRRRR